MMCGFMGNGRAQHVTHLVCCNRALLPENLAFGMLALFINFTLCFFLENKDSITHCFLSLCFYFGQYFILLCFGILIWNPSREARHGFPARDKKHEIRLDVRK